MARIIRRRSHCGLLLLALASSSCSMSRHDPNEHACHCPAPPDACAAPTGVYQRMSEAQVRTQLGEPTRTTTEGGWPSSRARWTYERDVKLVVPVTYDVVFKLPTFSDGPGHVESTSCGLRAP
jgi:hypothetical protein